MRVCLHKRFSLSLDDAAHPLVLSTSDCSADADGIFTDAHLLVCLDEACSDVLNVPTVAKTRNQADSFVQRMSVLDRCFWEPSDVVTFYAKLQRAATHCSTLQHTAPYSSIL